jgi:hypothetical protein
LTWVFAGITPAMKLPEPRGPVSGALIHALGLAPHDLVFPLSSVTDDDLHLALFVLYELNYRGWDGVDDRWEWHPDLIRLRGLLEEQFESALRALVSPFADAVPSSVTAAAVARTLVTMTSADDGPSLHLREADPHTFAIPRLSGRPKAALIEIQIDEYGGGRANRMHQEMFRATMTGLGLDTTYGAYVDRAPALTLATNNLMSLFGLHRRRRGALLGHLAAYEMTSTAPNRAYGNGLRRLGGDADATRFYDEHVEADAVHEQIAAYDMCGLFCEQEPELAADVLFGARCALALDTLWAEQVLSRWEMGESSLRPAWCLS